MKHTDCKKYLLCCRERRRLSREARRAIREFHRGHADRHRETTREYVAGAGAFVIGRLGSRGELVELQAFREGAAIGFDSVKHMRVLSHRKFSDTEIALDGDAAGFITTYEASHKWKTDDCDCECPRPKERRPWLLIRRDRFDKLAAECAGYRRTKTLLCGEGEDIAKAAAKLIDEIDNEFSGDADDELVDIVNSAGRKE